MLGFYFLSSHNTIKNHFKEHLKKTKMTCKRKELGPPRNPLFGKDTTNSTFPANDSNTKKKKTLHNFSNHRLPKPISRNKYTNVNDPHRWFHSYPVRWG